MDMLFELKNRPAGSGVPWVPFMLIFFKRILDSGYIRIQVPVFGVSITLPGLDTTPLLVILTDKGREFIDGLGIHELDPLK
jgi:hypothetical protein